MGPYARVKRDYKDVFGEERKKNPYYEADNMMVPVLAGDPVIKVPFAKERKRKRNQSSSSEKEKVPNGQLPGHEETSVGVHVGNGHVKTMENGAVKQSIMTTNHVKDD